MASKSFLRNRIIILIRVSAGRPNSRILKCSQSNIEKSHFTSTFIFTDSIRLKWLIFYMLPFLLASNPAGDGQCPVEITYMSICCSLLYYFTALMRIKIKQNMA